MAAGSVHAMSFAPPRTQMVNESDADYKAYRDYYNSMVSSATNSWYGSMIKK